MCFGPVGRVQSVCAGGRGEYRGGVIPEAAYVQWARRGCQREGDECWGARLLQLQGPDGHYGGGPYVCPGWTSTTDTLLLLRELGLDPTSEQARRAVAQVVANATWGPEFGNSPFFEGEVEPCIKREGPRRRFVLRRGERLVDRLLNEQLEDGGWNCEAPRSQRSSFHSTICVLEGLLEYENAQGATLAVTGARLRDRSIWWRAGVEPDHRVAEAVDLVETKRDAQGRWPLENPHAGEVHFELEDGAGTPSRWNTLRALRVLDWHSR